MALTVFTIGTEPCPATITSSVVTEAVPMAIEGAQTHS